MDYIEFLKTKIELAVDSGLEVDRSKINKALKPHQKDAVAWALKCGRRALFESFGFGKKRLTDFEIAFDRKTRDATDFDYLGQHYVTLEDYATQLNEEFRMHIDVERVSKCQQCYKGEEAKEMADVRELIKVLRDGGFEDAATFIEEKI